MNVELSVCECKGECGSHMDVSEGESSGYEGVNVGVIIVSV